MKPEEMIELLKGMQSPLEDYAELVGAPAFAYGHKYVYPYPEDYAIGEAIEALKEIQQYREMDKKLREAYGDCDGLLAIAVEGLCKHSGINIGEPIKARLLTDADVDKWDAYREIGTVEECRKAAEKQKPKKPKLNYKPRFLGKATYTCPKCGNCCLEEFANERQNNNYCWDCGQAIRWDENLEETENEQIKFGVLL